MTDSTAKPRKQPHGVHYPDSVKELAYEVWLVKAGESITKTQELLRSGQFGEALDVPERTLYQWQADYQWKVRKSEFLKAFTPSIREYIFGEILFTSKELVDIIRNKVQKDEPIDKTLAALTVQYLDRSGFSPMGKNDAGKLLDDVKPAAKELPANLAALSPEELMRLEAEYKASKTRRA